MCDAQIAVKDSTKTHKQFQYFTRGRWVMKKINHSTWKYILLSIGLDFLSVSDKCKVLRVRSRFFLYG